MRGTGRWVGMALLAASLGFAALALGAVSGTTHKVSGVLDFEEVACPAKGPCIAVGETPRSSQNESTGAFVTVSSGGKPGSVHKVAGSNLLSRVACPAANQCIAVGEKFGQPQSAVYVKISHGRAGKIHSLPISGAASIGCGSSTSCWVLGDDFPARPGGSSDFHPAVVHLVNGKVAKTFKPMGNFDFFAGESGGAEPACFSANSCIAVGTLDFTGQGPGAIFSLRGGKVKIAHKVSGTSVLSGLDCTSHTFCTIVGDKFSGETEQGKVTTLSNGKVGKVRSAMTGVSLFPLACISASSCYGFGNRFTNNTSESLVVKINHGKPGQPQKIGTFITAATCHKSHCLAVGDVGTFPHQEGTIFAFTG